jgi:hypothetical protein
MALATIKPPFQRLNSRLDINLMLRFKSFAKRLMDSKPVVSLSMVSILLLGEGSGSWGDLTYLRQRRTQVEVEVPRHNTRPLQDLSTLLSGFSPVAAQCISCGGVAGVGGHHRVP